MQTRYGIEITEWSPVNGSYIGTADGMGYGAPLQATYGAPTVPANDNTPWFDRDTTDADADPDTGLSYLDVHGADDDVRIINDPSNPWHTTYDAGTDVTTVNIAAQCDKRAINDLTVDCCGRDAADCDCNDDTIFPCGDCGIYFDTHGYADVCDDCAAEGNTAIRPETAARLEREAQEAAEEAIHDGLTEEAAYAQAQDALYGGVRRYDVYWHWLVLPGERVTRVVVGGDPGLYGTTEDDIPAIIAVAQTGSNKNADLVVIDSMTLRDAL